MRLLLVLLVALTACHDSASSLESQYQQAQSWFQADHFDLALPKVERGLQRSTSAHNLQYEWRFRLLKAEMLLNRRRLPEGVAALNAEPPDGAAWLEVKGRKLFLQGVAAYYKPDYLQAGKLFASAADAARQAGAAGLAAEVDLYRGPLLVRQDKGAEAEAVLRNVNKAAAELHDPYLQARAAFNLGFVLQKASRYDEAMEWLERAGALFRQLGADTSALRVAGNAGTCYLRLGDYENARIRFEQAENAAVRLGNRSDQQTWIGNLGNVAFEQGQYAAAAQQYRRGLEISTQLHDKVWTERWMGNLADALIYMGDLAPAEDYNNQALELSRGIPGTEPYCLFNAARIAAARKDTAEAERLFRRALKLPAEDPTILLDTHRGLAALYVQTARPREAEAEFRAAIAEMDRISAGLVQDEHRLSYLDSLIRFHGAYIDFLMSRHEIARALEVAESSRAKVLAQRSGRREVSRPQTAPAFQGLAERAHSVVLEYWIGQSQSYLWVVTPRSIRNYPLPAAAELRELVDTYQKAIMAQENPLETAAGSGRKLRDLLVSPAMDQPCGDCRFLIVPDKLLYSLNFESLPGKRDGQFWIEDAAVTIAPSVNYLIESVPTAQPRQRTAMLLIGDPDPVLSQYPKLDYAGREIDRIAGLLKGSSQKVLRGADARPDSYVKAEPGSFDLIHFSAHAEANPLSPLDSAVVLSGAPEECRLFARDVAAIPLHAELVAISACRSVGSKTYSGEGPVGFAWAFLKAGARNVIAGLWDVNDRSTAALMGDLYARIAGGAAVTDALRGSKLAMLHGGGLYARPYFWAPFELYTGEAPGR